MEVVNIPLGTVGDIEVDEASGTFTIKVQANIFGNPEAATFTLSVAEVLSGIVAGITNPILKQTLTWAIELL